METTFCFIQVKFLQLFNCSSVCLKGPETHSCMILCSGCIGKSACKSGLAVLYTISVMLSKSVFIVLGSTKESCKCHCIDTVTFRN